MSATSAGRQETERTAPAPPITSAASTLPIIRAFVIRPDSFLRGSFLVLLLAQIRGQCACRAFFARHNLETLKRSETSRTKPFSDLNECHTHEDDTVVLRIFERVRVRRRSHAVSNSRSHYQSRNAA